jgi:hypothetical protein
MRTPVGVASCDFIMPRRRFKSPIVSPTFASGTNTSTFMIGSSSCGPAFGIDCR